MAFITEIFGTGVVSPENNEALQRLSSLLGTKLIFGTTFATGPGGQAMAAGNDNNTLLLLLSSALGPVYLAMLFLILAWIAVGGTAKSAMDGEFLGRDWSTIGVPASLIFSVILLSPVPQGIGGGGGLTMAQVIYVRAIVLGSNFGDLVLKTAYEQSNIQASNEAAARQSLSDPAGAAKVRSETYKQVSTRMQKYLGNYLCAEQLIASGVNRQYTYYMSLTGTCKIPKDAQYLYNDYFNFSFKRWTGQMDASGNPVYQAVTVAKPSNVRAAGDKNTSAREYVCYYKAFQQTYTQPGQVTGTTLSGLGVSPYYAGVTTPSIYPSSKSPTIIKDAGSDMKEIKLDKDVMIAGWMQAVSTAVQCLEGSVPHNSGFIDHYTGRAAAAMGMSSEQQLPWIRGWSTAARFMKTELNNANAYPGTPLPLEADIEAPDIASATKTQGGPVLRASLDTLKSQVDGLAKPVNDLVNTVVSSVNSEIGQKLAANCANAADRALCEAEQAAQGAGGGSIAMPGHGNYTDTRRLVGAAAMTGVIGSMVGNPRGQAAMAENFANIFKTGVGSSFLRQLANTLSEKAATATIKGPGQNLTALGRAASYLRGALTTAKMTKDTAEEVTRNLSNQPGVGAVAAIGGAAGRTVLGKAMAIFSQPGMATILFTCLTVMNIMALAPEIAMTLALLIWLLRVAAWFLIVPISAVLIALPKTNVGHNAWKEGLALALTPGITMLFFIVSMLMFDIVIDVSWAAMAQPYLVAMENSILGGAGKFLIDLLTGEIVYRILALTALLCMGFFFTIYLILRGPSWALQRLGLSGDDEFSRQTQQMEGMIEKPKSPRH